MQPVRRRLIFSALVLAGVATLLVSLVKQNGAAKPISVDIEPMPIARATQSLSKHLGRSVGVSPELENLTLMVYAPRVSREELMAKIAQVTNATWQEQFGWTNLLQMEKQRSKDDDAYYSAIRSRQEKLFEHHKKAAKSFPPFTKAYVQSLLNELRILGKKTSKDRQESNYERGEVIARQSPIDRLRHRMMLGLDPKIFDDLYPNPTKIFALHPKGTEAPLPPSVADAVARFIAEQNVLAEVTGGKPVKTGDPYFDSFDFCDQVAPFVSPPSEIVFEVARMHSDHYAITLSLYDAKKSLVLQIESNTWEPIEPSSDWESVDDGKWKQLSLEAQTLYRLNFAIRDSKEPPLASLLTTLPWKSPSAKDPLAYYTAEFLKQEAKAKGKNLVAILSDSLLDFSRHGLIGQMLRFQSEDPIFSKLLNVRVEENDNWILIRPLHLRQAREETYDRQLLDRGVAFRQGEKPFTLEAEAEIASLESRRSWYSDLKMVVDAFATNPFETKNDFGLLRIYRALSDFGIEKGSPSGGVKLADLPYSVTEELLNMIAERNPALEAYKNGQGPFDTQSMAARSLFLWSALPVEVKRPFVSALNGDRKEIRVRMKRETSYVVQSPPDLSDNLKRAGSLLDASELSVLTSETKGKSPVMLRLIRKDQIRIVFELPSGYQLVGSLVEYQQEAEPPFPSNAIPTRVKPLFKMAALPLRAGCTLGPDSTAWHRVLMEEFVVYRLFAKAMYPFQPPLKEYPLSPASL